MFESNSTVFMKKKTKVILTLLFILQLVGLRLLAHFPETVERYYSLGVYPLISKIFRYVFGWIPFSVGDLFYLILIALAIRWVVLHIKSVRKKPISFFLSITATLCIGYAVFNVMWGFNYYRVPLHKTLQINSEYSTEELLTVTNKLIAKANHLHTRLSFSDSGVVEIPYEQHKIFKLSTNGYENLSHRFPTLEYRPKSIKKSGWSLGLTYMGYSGYYNPFTAEAQVNNKIDSYLFPVVVCHEEAHQLGYAAENEANFLAFLASSHNEDVYMQYAGTLFALRYCVNELARQDKALYDEIIKDVHPGILQAYKEMRDFWNSYHTPLENVSKLFFDTFLKANNQERGIKSYSYMVALVVNYDKKYPEVLALGKK